MQVYRCKCGAATAWNTGEAHQDCEGCEKCQTTYAQRPGDHKPLIPHDFKEIKEIEIVDGVETVKSYYRQCRLCYYREKIKKCICGQWAVEGQFCRDCAADIKSRPEDFRSDL